MAEKLSNIGEFGLKISKLSGEEIYKCYQCGKCTASCPVALDMPHKPNQIMRFIQLGFKENVLNSPTIWLCASCITCSARCPKGIDIAKIMDTLRILCLEKGYKPGVSEVSKFNEIFLNQINSLGRIHEPLLAMLFNIKTGHFFQDALLGLKLFKKGKMVITPNKLKDLGPVKNIFNKSNPIIKND